MVAFPAPDGLDVLAWHVAATVAWMAIWWMMEAVPVAVTALLPIPLFPLLGVFDIAETTAPYANPVIFLFLGGFIMAQAIERWNLHRRIALAVLALAGTRPDRLVGGFMLATAALSMWVSNTATTVMMLPIGLSVIALLKPDSKETGAGVASDSFALALLLGIAYSASIGGLATLIGTPPNALLAGFMRQSYGVTIGFFEWMLFGLPVASTMLAVTWLLMSRILLPRRSSPIAGAAAVIASERSKLGAISQEELKVAVIVVSVALLWAFRPALSHWLPVSDPAIAILGAIALFVVPASRERGAALLDWGHAKALPWSVLLLFGGGLSLAQGIADSGLAAWIGAVMAACGGWPLWTAILFIAGLVVFLTEITSNTATAAIFLPITASLGACIGHDPLLFAVPAALAASCAFMLPVATPPNAIVFGSGLVTVPQMARAGLAANLMAVAVILLATLVLLPQVFDLS